MEYTIGIHSGCFLYYEHSTVESHISIQYDLHCIFQNQFVHFFLKYQSLQWLWAIRWELDRLPSRECEMVKRVSCSQSQAYWWVHFSAPSSCYLIHCSLSTAPTHSLVWATEVSKLMPVTPPARGGSRTMTGAENFLGSIKGFFVASASLLWGIVGWLLVRVVVGYQVRVRVPEQVHGYGYQPVGTGTGTKLGWNMGMGTGTGTSVQVQWNGYGTSTGTKPCWNTGTGMGTTMGTLVRVPILAWVRVQVLYICYLS